MTETDSVNALWRTRPVFITSTFQDLQAERDHLQQVVFPQLEEALRGRRHYLEPIDLRTGIDPTGASEETRELQVLKVCLDEIERSRPYLIVILGDRYGWIPDATRLKAAAQEAGLISDITGHSVTALEIEFGLFMKDPDQRRRCFFYFREPLPYAQMPPDLAARYSDAEASDSDAPHRQKALAALKAKIENDPELAPRVRHYQATWDSTRQRVTGLDAWGQQVFNDLWSDLDEETKAFAAQPAPTWEQQERQALEAFLELRRHNYTGREALLVQLTEFTQTPTASETQWGLCLTGEAGAGKSALLAELVRRLNAQDDSLLLTHAAGISPRANDVLAMLQRWIAELAQFLKKANPLSSNANAETIEQTFASLLGQAAQSRRIIVLIDALNQFEATPRGRFVTWLPKLWPPNARLLVTTQPGEQSEALRQKPGIKNQVLAPLTATDARSIAQRIWARYHRQAPSDVIDVLINKTRTDANPAYGNPLWLSFAAEELNLLDADDFNRAEKSYEGPILERIHQLNLEIATQLPAEVEALYAWRLERCAKTFGRAFTHAYAAAIALSRFGWRDSDLKVLVPRLAHAVDFMCDLSAWDELHLAALRRSFRAHLMRRGQLERWDFFHSQARRAIESSVLPNPELRKRMHSIIADHLLDLSGQDPLRNSEALWHLIGADDQPRAAKFYAQLPNPLGLANEATDILATYILSTSDAGDNPSLTWTIGLLNQPELKPDMVWQLADCFQYDLNDALSSQAQLGTRHKLLAASLVALKKCVARDSVAADPSNSSLQNDLGACYQRLFDLYRDQGDLDEALRAAQAGLTIFQRLSEAYPKNPEWHDGQVGCYQRMGDLYFDQKYYDSALRAYQDALEICQQLADADPSNTDFQHGLVGCHERLGLSYMYGAQHNYDRALHAFQTELAICQQLTDADPSNIYWQRELGACYERIGEVYRNQGNLTEALNAFYASSEIFQRLADADPTNANWQYGLGSSHERFGGIYSDQGDLDSALRAYQEAFTCFQSLVDADPRNAHWQRAFWFACWNIATILEQLNDCEATHYWLKAYQVLSAMKVSGMFISCDDEKILSFFSTKIPGHSLKILGTERLRSEDF